MSNSWFKFKRFTVIQDRCAMKVGTDGVLLGAWAPLDGGLPLLDIGAGTGIVSLVAVQRLSVAMMEPHATTCGGYAFGAGCSICTDNSCNNSSDHSSGGGNAPKWVTAVELDHDAAAQAAMNFESSPWAGCMECVCCDVNNFNCIASLGSGGSTDFGSRASTGLGSGGSTDLDSEGSTDLGFGGSTDLDFGGSTSLDFGGSTDLGFGGSTDLDFGGSTSLDSSAATGLTPGTAARSGSGTAGGRFGTILCNPPYFRDSLRCPDGSRNAARHGDSLNFDDLGRCVGRLLSPDGLFSAIIPFDAVRDFVRAMAACSLYHVRETDVCTKVGKEPKRSLVSFSFKLSPCCKDTISILDSEGQETPEYVSLVKDFYLKY